jgi:hypothetical protein
VPRLDGLAPAAAAPNAEAQEWLSSSPDALPGLAEQTAYVTALTTAGYYPEDATGLLTPAGLDPDIVVFETRPDWLEGCDLSWWGGPAVAPTPVWPRRRDGQPLAHVFSVHLGEVQWWEWEDDDMYEAWGAPRFWLPDQGVLQVSATGVPTDSDPTMARVSRCRNTRSDPAPRRSVQSRIRPCAPSVRAEPARTCPARPPTRAMTPQDLLDGRGTRGEHVAEPAVTPDRDALRRRSARSRR